MKVGVTLTTATIGDVPVFFAVNEGMDAPVPSASRPIEGWLFVHLYVVVPTVFNVPKLTSDVGDPAQTTWLSMALTWAVGLTVIVKVSGAPRQLIPLAV